MEREAGPPAGFMFVMAEDDRLSTSEDRERQLSEAGHDETGKVRAWLRPADQMNNVAPDQPSEPALVVELIRPDFTRRRTDRNKKDAA